MRIGVDLDNTLACYDTVFARLARAHGWLEDGAATTKGRVRAHLLQIGREDLWTEIQGEAYGPRMNLAQPFPGALEVITKLSRAATVFLVSHRSHAPYAGPPHDLHRAARDWLAAATFVGHNGPILPHHVHLETTRSAKIARIAALGCRYFVDDQLELLIDPDFPSTTTPVLFDPHGVTPEPPVQRCSSWHQIDRIIRLKASCSPR